MFFKIEIFPKMSFYWAIELIVRTSKALILSTEVSPLINRISVKIIADPINHNAIYNIILTINHL